MRYEPPENDHVAEPEAAVAVGAPQLGSARARRAGHASRAEVAALEIARRRRREPQELASRHDVVGERHLAVSALRVEVPQARQVARVAATVAIGVRLIGIGDQGTVVDAVCDAVVVDVVRGVRA